MRTGRPSMSPEPRLARFWEQVSRTDGCWEWTGNRYSNGYGVTMYHGRKAARAHRVSWEFHHGPIPDGLFVCHSCDNPPCINPAHLFLGTSQDNTNDMISKGRHCNGYIGRTHCSRGHEYTAENTRFDPRKNERVCLTCQKSWRLAYRERQGKPSNPFQRRVA